ncbi:MAG: type II toxin-antitoxin system VapC family toxin [Acidobacteria bacterium]|nr:type II toxin-antitoxin system VapC family toxin [Acidobacteriota bacterium]
MNHLLLDTEALIWWDANDPRLGGNARALIQDAPRVYVSAASAWEIAIKTALGKLRTSRRASQVVVDAAFSELPITFEHTERVSTLPSHHSDPFDRLLVAVALVEGLTIVSSDRHIALYDVPVVDARQ